MQHFTLIQATELQNVLKYKISCPFFKIDDSDSTKILYSQWEQRATHELFVKNVAHCPH